MIGLIVRLDVSISRSFSYIAGIVWEQETEQPVIRSLEVDTGPFSSAELASVLGAGGIALIDGFELDDVDRALAGVTSPFHHPDSRENGVTYIQPKDGVVVGGFSRLGLAIHTDRSTIDEPPDILVFTMDSPSGGGGDCVFADGQAIVRILLRKFSKSEVQSLKIRLVDGSSEFPFLSQMRNGRYRIRYRNDHVGRPQSDVPHLVMSLEESIEELSWTLQLAAGMSYVVDNSRWLHGRTPFDGPRSARRRLFTVGESDMFDKERGVEL